MNLTPELAAAEFAAGMTALECRIKDNANHVIAALSENGKWGYEKEGRWWVAFERASNGVGSTPCYAGSLKAARQATFELDHPMHGPEREPRPMRFTVA